MEEELEQHGRDAADREAIMQALENDRADLAELYSEAHMELRRLGSELSERTAELAELRHKQEQAELRLAQNTCVVCLDLPAAVACVPCGHLALCEACAGHRRVRQCPVCRRCVVTLLRIYAC